MNSSLFFIPEVCITPLFGFGSNLGRGFVSFDHRDHFYSRLFSACFNEGYIFQVLKDFNDISCVKFLNQLLKIVLAGLGCFLGLHKTHELFGHCVQVSCKRLAHHFGQSDITFPRVNSGKEQQVRFYFESCFFRFGHIWIIASYNTFLKVKKP